MRLPVLILLAVAVAAACGGGSSATPTAPTATAPTPTATPAPPPAPTTTQATSIATGIGGLTATALASGASQFGIASVGSGRVIRMAASGSTFSSTNCSSSGKMDLIYTRDYTPTSAGVDLTALKEVFTSCVMANDAPAVSGELAMAGTYTGSSQIATITLTGSLTTPAGGCPISGAVTARGSFSGTACGSTVAATTPPPIASPAPPTTPAPPAPPSPPPAPPAPTITATGTWTGTWTNYDPRFGCGRSDNSVRMTLTQSGTSITGTMSWTITSSYFPPDVGMTQTHEITGTANGSALTLTLGPATGTATMTATSMTGAFTMPPPAGVSPCPLPNAFTLSRQ